MQLGHFQLIAQSGAGADGVGYRARDTNDGQAVEVRILSGARNNPSRWKQLSKRLRLASLLKHPSTLGLRELNLQHDPPYVSLESLDTDGFPSAVRERGARQFTSA